MSRREDVQERSALAGGGDLLAGFRVDLRLGHFAADVEDQQGGKDADPEHGPPGRSFRQHREKQAVAEAARPQPMAQPPCTVPTALPRCWARMVSPISTEPTAHSPPKPKPLQAARDQQLPERVGEAAQEGEEGEPDDGELQDAGPAEAVGQRARQPAADGGDQQRRPCPASPLGPCSCAMPPSGWRSRSCRPSRPCRRAPSRRRWRTRCCVRGLRAGSARSPGLWLADWLRVS